ncbi:hypothetical protein BH23GEM11_BH23GEM11_17120 [soil metagenome]
MRTRILTLLLFPLIALTACESATEPHPVDAPERWSSSESAVSSTYRAILLPEGRVGSTTSAVLDENGGVFGTVIDEATSLHRAAKWTADASGQVAAPVRLGELPAPYQAWGQYVRATERSGDVVVGYAQHGGSLSTVPWLWSSGIMTLLPMPEDAIRGWAIAIGEDGVVTGQVRFEDQVGHGAVWLPPYTAPPHLLPLLEGRIVHVPHGITSGGVIGVPPFSVPGLMRV